MTYRSPLLLQPGGVEASGSDAGVAAHYSDPLREQRALARGEAVVDLSHRGVVTVAGEDRLSWLNTLSSQLLLNLQPGQSSEALLLTVQGRIEYDARIVDDGERTWLIVESFEAAPLAAWLESMKFMLRVDIADVSADWAVVGSVKPVPAFDGRTVWQDPWPQIGAGGYAYTGIEEPQHPGLERTWYEYLLPAAELESAVSGLQLAGGPFVPLRIARHLRRTRVRERRHRGVELRVGEQQAALVGQRAHGILLRPAGRR